MVRAIEILPGQQFGLLTVVREVPHGQRKNSYQRRSFIVQCSCGSEPHEIEQRNLLSAMTQSCGCIRVKAQFVATNKFGVDMDYINQFDDFEKYAFIHKQLVKLLRFKTLVEEYDVYIQHFYYDEQFNKMYNFWRENVEKRGETFYDLWKPSLDHKTPTSRGGSYSYENLHFITLFENLAKRDMTWEEWEKFKQETDFGKDLMIGGRKL